MSGKDLFEGMSYVDDGFVHEAEYNAFPKPRVSLWIKAASMAACLCLILFCISNMGPWMAPEDPGSVADTAPNGSLADPMEQESNVFVPGEIPTGEVPSVILCVEEMTATGFIGTVAELVDTDIFEIGMELNVVVADGTRHEVADGDHGNVADSKTDYSGSYVMVQFIAYDRETGTIVVNIIQEIPKEG